MIRNDLKYGAICLAFVGMIVLFGCHSEQNGIAVAEIHEGDHLTSYSQEITSPIHEFTVEAGGTYTVDINAKNTGRQPWFGRGQAAWVDASYRWVDSNGNVLPIEGKRTLLDRLVIRPGESDPLKMQVVAPSVPGSYSLWISMVQEGVNWFYARGTQPLVMQVTVQ